MWPFLQTPNTSCGCEQSGTNQCGCDKISSLDVSYNGPALVCSGIELCDSLSVALQKIEEKICTAGNISGSGINNYVARWTPNGNTLGTGLIQDNGTTTSINTVLDNSWLFKMTTSSQRFTQRVENTYASSIPGNNSIGLSVISSGVNTGGNNLAINAFATNCTISNVAVTGRASGTSILNQGGYFEATSGTTNVGARFYAASGTNYAVQLQDGTQGIGKFLKSITTDGHANWANITAADVSGVVGGLGTNNYVARWTPSGTQLGIGIIQDDNTSVGINTAPDANTVMLLRTSGSEDKGIYSTNDSAATTNKNAVYGFTSGINTAENRGLEGIAQDSTLLNIGVSGIANSGTGGAVGGSFDAQGTGTNYAVRLRDGTEGIGKVLTCQTLDGKANWVTPTSSGLSGSGTDGYVARWTPNSTTLSTGLIQDNNATLSIGTTLDPDIFINILASKPYGAILLNTNTTNVITSGLAVETNGVNTLENRGIEAYSSNSTLVNTAFRGAATSSAGVKAVGGHFIANGLGVNYAVRLSDGTESLGKVLTCMTANGEANWNKVNSTYTTGASGSFTSNDGKTITVTNGLITSII